MTIYDRYGRLRELYECECEAHAQTIALVRGLVNGEIASARVTMQDNGWTLAAVNGETETPACRFSDTESA